MSTVLPLARQAGEGIPVSFANVRLSVMADYNATGGRCSAFEYTVPAAFAGPPLHYHGATEEIFYVLEGTVTFYLDGESLEAGPGAFIYMPAGSPHTFSNPGPQPARMLVVNTPGGFEGYFQELALLMEQEPAWPPADTGKVWALMAKYDTYPVGG